MARRARDARGRFLKRKRTSSRKTRRRNPARRYYTKRRARRPAPARRRTHVRRRRRNPVRRIGGIAGMLPSAGTVIGGAAGALAVRAVPGFLAKQFPALPLTGPAGLGVKAISGLLTGMVVQMIPGVPKKFGRDLTLGALITVTDEALRTYLYPTIGLPLEAYLDPALSGYLPVGYSDVRGAEEVGQYLAPGAALPLGFMEEGIPSRMDPSSRM